MNVGKFYRSAVPGCHVGTKVHGSDDRDIKNALQNWKRKLKDAGTLQEFKDKREFIKPSERKRKQKDHAVYFQKIEQRRMDE